MHVLARYVYNLWLGMLCYGLLMPRVFILFLGQGQASAIVRVTWWHNVDAQLLVLIFVALPKKNVTGSALFLSKTDASLAVSLFQLHGC